ncbi:alpha/beta hydrolase [Streptomyces sp. NPDC093085]|uniref:alpha/beta fold hydrolase n=1 Tax=Streptomyces sp. NPDC093085 TaxID=3155068 RepID=UPI00344563C7
MSSAGKSAGAGKGAGGTGGTGGTGGGSGAGHVQGVVERVPTRDGRTLHAMVLAGPSGTEAGAVPTVVFEAGAAATRSSWALVQPLVAEAARAVVYDRAGLGLSPADPGPRTLPRMAEDLADLLDHFGPGPYILVGHSAGGPLVRLAAAGLKAAGHPDRVRALVLVDPTDEGTGLLFRPLFRRAERATIAVTLLLARVGLLRFLFGWLAKALPEDARRDLLADGLAPGVIRTQRAQSRTYLDDVAAFRTAPPDVTGIPVTVISGALPGSGISRATRRAINRAHAASAAAASPGRHVIAEQSGHYIPVTEPELVAEEIRRLV